MDELVDLDEERLSILDALMRQKKRIDETYIKKVGPKSSLLEIMFGRLYFLSTRRIKLW